MSPQLLYTSDYFKTQINFRLLENDVKSFMRLSVIRCGKGQLGNENTAPCLLTAPSENFSLEAL